MKKMERISNFLFMLVILVLLIFGCRLQATGEPRIIIEPEDVCMDQSIQRRLIHVTIEEVSDLAGFEFVLSYPQEILYIEDAEADIQLGPFLGSTGNTVTKVLEIGHDHNDQKIGKVTFGAFSLPNFPYPSGSGNLARFFFTLHQPGTGMIHIESLQLIDSQGNIMSVGYIGVCHLYKGTDIRIRTPEGGDLEEFELGRNKVKISPLCSYCYSHELIRDYKAKDRQLTIYKLDKDLPCHDISYLFFERPCGRNFSISEDFAYIVDLKNKN